MSSTFMSETENAAGRPNPDARRSPIADRTGWTGAARGGPDAVRVTLGQSENSRSGRSGKKSGGAIILPQRQLRYSIRRPRDIVSGRSAWQA
ncbi:hypothetical protein [Kaistia sp. MMO-174]|uniref:hypothetical protein n=1 Tax=Kaistia sp. MMO-174 TaxID=3081256 RepID=UPI003019F2F5